jgi:branched-chain amino acid transport system ATP-binding protein
VNSKNDNYILKISGVVMSFGGLMALYKPDFNVIRKTITSIIGPNGAGKTTLFNVITGFLIPDKGNVLFNDISITGFKPHQVAKTGISRTFQTVEVFKNMTVLENVMLGVHTRIRSSLLSSGFNMPGARRKEKEIFAKARDILKFTGLYDKMNEPAGSLPLGEQKILEIARALAGDPLLICLDEPAAGLNETESYIASSLVKAIKEKGITVLLVEHDMKVIMDISDHIIVLNYGQKIAEGAPEEIRKNTKVIEAYLGNEGHNA